MTLMHNATRFSVLLIQEVVGHHLYRFAFCDHFFCTAIFILCVASCPQNTQNITWNRFIFLPLALPHELMLLLFNIRIASYKASVYGFLAS